MNTYIYENPIVKKVIVNGLKDITEEEYLELSNLLLENDKVIPNISLVVQDWNYKFVETKRNREIDDWTLLIKIEEYLSQQYKEVVEQIEELDKDAETIKLNFIKESE